jgi:hypothetical protein
VTHADKKPGTPLLTLLSNNLGSIAHGNQFVPQFFGIIPQTLYPGVRGSEGVRGGQSSNCRVLPRGI